MFDLVLRPYDPRRDLEYLLEAYADPTEQAQFANHAPVNDVRAFDEWLTANLRSAYRDFRVAEERVSGCFVGFAHSYDVRPFDGHCKVCVYVTPEYRKVGGGGWLAVAFMGELFRLYPLRKVYTAVYAYNDQSLNSCLSAGFEEEGRLRAYRYFDGAYHDCCMLGLTRERYFERLLPLVEGGAGAGDAAGSRAGAEGGEAPADLASVSGRHNVEGAVLGVLARVRGGEAPAMDARLVDDLGFDSFDMLAALAELEDELCAELDANVMGRSTTVAELCVAVRKAVAA